MTINQKIRIKYIDAYIGVNGHFNCKHLERSFQISSPQSTRDLREYRKINPNAPYSHSKQASIPNSDFKMSFFKDKRSAADYLMKVSDIYEVLV